MKHLFLSALLGVIMSITANAAVVSEEINYKVDGEDFTGFLAWDDANGKRPGVLIVHEWWGHNDYARERAKQLAAEGYTAFALDMYGSGKQAEHPKDAGTFMKQVFSNMPAAEKRFMAAWKLLNNHKATQKGRIAAFGYCFGGAVALHMARVGAPLDAVASFHGSLGSQLPEDVTPKIQGAIHVYTGGADSMVPADQVAGFTEEMFNAGVDFNVRVYQGVKHSFTNPGADAIAEKFDMPIGYDADADADSWQSALRLLGQTFGQ